MREVPLNGTRLAAGLRTSGESSSIGTFRNWGATTPVEQAQGLLGPACASSMQ